MEYPCFYFLPVILCHGKFEARNFEISATAVVFCFGFLDVEVNPSEICIRSWFETELFNQDSRIQKILTTPWKVYHLGCQTLNTTFTMNNFYAFFF